MQDKHPSQSGHSDRISAALKQLPVQQAPERIMRRAMQQIETEQKLARHRVVNTGLGLALAASLFAAIMIPNLFSTQDNPDDTLSSITMSLNDPHTVNIVFDSPEAVEQATITVSLPDNLRIAGYESTPQLRWKTSLRAGKNTLSIPLVANNRGEGVVRSQLEINGQTKTFSLLVDVADSLPPASAVLTTNT